MTAIILALAMTASGGPELYAEQDSYAPAIVERKGIVSEIAEAVRRDVPAISHVDPWCVCDGLEPRVDFPYAPPATARHAPRPPRKWT